jgi:cytochrome c oxidase assembly factor 1
MPIAFAVLTVVRTLLFNLRASEIVKDALGEGVRPKPFLLGNEPWVHGKVNTIQGIVDISFRVESDSGRASVSLLHDTRNIANVLSNAGEGTLFFKSERRTKHGRFETIDFKLVVDGNPAQVVDLKNADLLGLNPV